MTGLHLEDNVSKLLRVVDELKADPTARVHCEFVDTAITAVMYQTKNQRELLELFPEVVQTDWTYRTNASGFYLSELIVVDGFGNGTIWIMYNY